MELETPSEIVKINTSLQETSQYQELHMLKYVDGPPFKRLCNLLV